MAAVRTRVLRGRPAAPFAFRAFDAPAEAPFAFAPLDAAAPAPEPFVALPALDEAPAPPPPSADFEAGRAVGAASRDGEVATLQAEVDRLASALDDARADAADRAAFAELAAARLAAAWDETLRRLQPELVALAVGTAQAVLDAPLSDAARAASESALRHAVDALAAEAPLTVALHPVDLLGLQESGLAASVEAAHAGLRWEADPSLDEGDWAVTTSAASVRRVRAEMLAAFRDRLSA